MFDGFGLTSIVMLLVCTILSLSIHEMMHAYVGHALGDTTAQDHGRLTLNPLKHIDLFTTVLLPVVLVILGVQPIFAAKPVPFNPDRVKYDVWGPPLIAVAGPFSNLVLAVICGLIVRLGLTDASPLAATFLVTMVSVNVGLFVFNLFPIPPLDGSRVLYAVAPEPVQEIMRRIESFGFMAVLFMLLLLMPIIAPAVGALTGYFTHLILPGVFY